MDKGKKETYSASKSSQPRFKKSTSCVFMLTAGSRPARNAYLRETSVWRFARVYDFPGIMGLCSLSNVTYGSVSIS